jgi:RNA polymerase sigma-70 factor (ECF subfamily)
VVDTFLAAARSGDFEGLLAVLDPEVVFRADAAAVRAGASSETRGASLVAKAFVGKAQAARAALIDGAVGAVVAPKGRLFLVLDFEVADGRIIGINAVADKDRLQEVEVGDLE